MSVENRRADTGVCAIDVVAVLEANEGCDSSVDVERGSEITSLRPTCLTFGLPSSRVVARANAGMYLTISYRSEWVRMTRHTNGIVGFPGQRLLQDGLPSQAFERHLKELCSICLWLCAVVRSMSLDLLMQRRTWSRPSYLLKHTSMQACKGRDDES